jgi:hypothetical protein
MDMWITPTIFFEFKEPETAEMRILRALATKPWRKSLCLLGIHCRENAVIRAIEFDRFQNDVLGVAKAAFHRARLFRKPRFCNDARGNSFFSAKKGG